jgi:branched-chain amino acid transport system ATP-binding protein
MKYLLEVSGLTVAYDGSAVVHGISLSVQNGEVVALLGSNGAGKSTLLKAISGLVPAVAGRIVFDGADLGGVDIHHRARRGLALVPEGRRLFSDLTVIENLRTGALARNGRSDERVDLERVYSLFPVLAAKASQLAASLSGGEQQMLALGRALMSAPRLLMIDEPSLGLSPIAAGALYQTIATLAGSGMTIMVA